MLHTIFISVLNMSITASIVIIAVLLARLLLKNAPKIFSYMLWAVVLFRLLCPISLKSDLSLMGILKAPVSNSGRIEFVALDSNNTDTPSVIISSPDLNQTTEQAAKPSLDEAPADNAFTSPVFWISLLWLCGATAMLIFNIVQFLQLRSKLIGAIPLDKNIYIADHISTPFVMGLLRPRIYLPSSLSDTEQAYIILHEKHHIRRGDNIIKLFAFAAVCVHWFNPFVWIAFILAGKDMEMSCDEAVMKQIGKDIRADYSSLLLQFSTDKKIIIGSPLAFGEGDTKERIKNIMKYKKPTFIIIILALILCMGLTACLSADPKSAVPKPASAQSNLPEIAIDKIDLNASTDVGVELAYESDDFIIFYGSIGLFGYDLNKKEITFAVDFTKAVGIEGSIQGSRGTSVDVSADGKTVIISDYDVEQNLRHKTCYIDIPTLTYTTADYKPLDNAFERESAKGYIYPGVKAEHVKYIRDSKEWVVFEH
ncbi:MAG: hypothetical protein IKB44_05385 [Clostridia bacterium]|nr:hypothetical protein [Clostridia bacterium]